jgi:EmrB/QacA subfamily drug resistance transporter
VSTAEEIEPDLRRAYLVLGVVGIGSFLTAMSLSIVFVVYPDLVDEFPNSSNSTLSWVLNVFTIVGAPLFVLGSVAGERYGRKRTMVLGLVGFTVTSVLAALAPGPGWLIVARALQAVFTALILPMTATIILNAFPEAHRGVGAASWSAIGGVAASTGPSLGGWLIDTWSWRAAFWLNVPIGIAATIATVAVLDESKSEEAPPVPDVVGMFALMGGVGLLVFGLVQSSEWGWASGSVIASMAAGAALIALLIHRSTRHPVPLIDLRLFRSRTYSFGNISMFMFALSFFGTQFGAIVFLRQVWGYDLLDAGLLSTPVFAFTALFSLAAGRISDRFGDEKLGAPAVAVWTIGVALLAIGLRDHRNMALWFSATSIAGAGAGLTWGGLFALVLRRVEPEHMSLAASITQTLQRLGNALGVAVAVTILGSRVGTTLGDHRRMFAAMTVAAVITIISNSLLLPRTRRGSLP